MVLSLLIAIGAGLLLVALNEAGTSQGLRPPLDSRGDVADIERVRSAVPVVISAADAAARIPLASDGEAEGFAQTLLSQEAAARRYEYLLSYLTPEKAADVARSVEDGLRANLTDPRFAASAYSDNRFTPSRYEGVQVDQDLALVIVRGRHEYLGHGGEWRSTDEAQYVVELVRDANSPVGWLLLEVSAVPVN